MSRKYNKFFGAVRKPKISNELEDVNYSICMQDII